MAFSKIVYAYTGQTTFAINFALGYLEESHVTARVNAEVDGGGDPVYRTITFITSGTVSISGTWVTDDEVVFERTTPKTELQHDFANGAVLNELPLDESHKQAIMISHEALDGRFAAFENDLDMGGNKITNLGTGTATTDAITLEQMTDAIAIASGLSGAFPASGVTYDGTISGLAATEVQSAIDEVVTDLAAATSSSADRVTLFKLLT